MKSILVSIVAAVVLVGCGESQKSISEETKNIKMGNNEMTKSFEEKLLVALNEAETKFKAKHQDFLIDISYKIKFDGEEMMSALIQILSRSVLNNVEDEEFGYGIHLAFDDELEALNRLKNVNNFTDYHYSLFDESVHTYQLDVKSDKKAVITNAKLLIEEVYLKKTFDAKIDIGEL
ncbi:MAG: hypothetical protein NZ707_03195 [Rhodospirillales bacterium]|nr:hypothetical protein [Rhodospirillales bacterium]